ncbi:peptidase inhibitor family I36 protein [Nonomuraea sp. B19D2]|uniref:peptidase inhibitor family I36 protein n=1 Tax=Nonomuraea sp. B19D2 TaxID=3159561 RepID=UPI0032DA2DDE
MLKIRTTMLALTLVLTPLTLTTPARAADGFGRCPSGHLCLFSERDGNGTIGAFRSGAPNLEPFGVLNPLAAWNRTSRTFCLYTYPDYVQLADTIAPGYRGGLNGEIAYSSVRAC